MTQDIEIEVRLPWHTICKLAVKAICHRVSLNELCVAAVKARIEGRS